jgi:hypothetical protein
LIDPGAPAQNHINDARRRTDFGRSPGPFLIQPWVSWTCRSRACRVGPAPPPRLGLSAIETQDSWLTWGRGCLGQEPGVADETQSPHAPGKCRVSTQVGGRGAVNGVIVATLRLHLSLPLSRQALRWSLKGINRWSSRYYTLVFAGVVRDGRNR